MPDYKFTYPSILEAESSMYNHVREVLISNKVEAQDVQRFMVVASEAFTNALIHGNKQEPSKHVLISLSINNTWISADIIDEGNLGSQMAQLENKGESHLPGPNAENGRGIALIRHYAEEVEFKEADTGGLKLSVRFKRRKREKKEKTLL